MNRWEEAEGRMATYADTCTETRLPFDLEETPHNSYIPLRQ